MDILGRCHVETVFDEGRRDINPGRSQRKGRSHCLGIMYLRPQTQVELHFAKSHGCGLKY